MTARPPRIAGLLAAVLCAAATVAAVPAAAGAATLGGWSRPQQKIVVNAGVMQTFSGRVFHGERRLTVPQMQRALDAITVLLGATRVPLRGQGTVSLRAFDRLLVAQLGLMDVARHLQDEARGSGLRPPARFGTEVVARQLGLRHNFPSADDRLELFPDDPITRAEAAYSLAQVVRFEDGWIPAVREQLMGLTLPRYGAAQRRVLNVALSRIGMPYVWGGEADGTYSSLGGWQAHGGYDCSGLVWRVFKLSGLPWGPRIQGRTAAQQAGEISRPQRLRLRQVRGGDLLFFGTANFTSTPTEANVVHEGIALTPEWMIQSSSQGVYLGSLTEKWRHDEFAWGRRVL